MKQPPTLYIFMGYPGAGKTTTARFIHELTGAEHLWADHERFRQFGAKTTHSAAESRTLYEALNDRTVTRLDKGLSVIYDTNFNYYEDRQLMRQIAADCNARCVLIWLTTSKDLSRWRATEDSAGKTIRIWDNMDPEDFERLSCKLEPPHDDEQVIRINGENLTIEDVAASLKD